MNDHTFAVVEKKLEETEFFLQHMAGAVDVRAFEFYLSAYLSAARTATLALQHFNHIPGFPGWYAIHGQRLRADPVSRYLLTARNEHVHGKPYPVARAVYSGGETQYFFPETDKQEAENIIYDIVHTCRHHLCTLLEVVFDCYQKLGVFIDPQQYYTAEHFARSGRGIEEAETEVWGWVMESYVAEGLTESDRWHELRGRVGECTINHLFYSYLGCCTPQPQEPEHYADFSFDVEDRARI